MMPNYHIDDTEVTTSRLTNGAPVGNTVKGKYEGGTNVFSLQGTWRF